MESLQQFISMLFGDKVTLDQIFTICVGIYAVVKSFTEWRATKKLINADKEMSAQQKDLQQLKEANDNLRTACVGLAEVITTAYLSSNTISTETKKELVNKVNAITEQSHISLSKPVSALIEAAEKGFNTDLSELKAEIVNRVEDVEEIIDIAKDTTKEAIDKLTV